MRGSFDYWTSYSVKKHSTHVIDEQAVHFFKGALPPEHWTVYDIRPDYGKDHKVELVEGGELMGQTFWVQIKGQKKVKPLKGGSISFKLETKDLDYQTRLQVPVFLIVVDVTKRVGYWVFTQEYERTQLRNVSWRSQEHIQIRIAASNRLSDLGLFRTAVKDAFGYLARRSLKLGILHAQESLGKLDSRFDVKVTATAHGEVVEANALKNLRVNFRFGTEFTQSGSLDKLINRGLPVQVRPGDVVVEGSLLVGSMIEETADHYGHLHFSLAGEGQVKLTRIDQSGQEIGRSHELACSFEGGLAEIRFQAGTNNGNLIMRGTCSVDPNSPIPTHIGYNLSSWLGRSLLNLSNFDLIHDLLGDLQEGQRMNFEFLADSNPIYSAYMIWGPDEIDSIYPLLDVIALADKARWIAKTFWVDAMMPHQIERDHFNEVAKIYRLARDEVIRMKGVVESASVEVSKINIETISKAVGMNGQPLRVAFVSDQPLPFLDKEVSLGPIETQLSHMLLADDSDALMCCIQAGISPVPLTWEATPDSEFIIGKISEELASSYQVAMEKQLSGEL